MKVIFDVDGTLYSFQRTQLDTKVFERIHRYIEAKLHKGPAEAKALNDAYYQLYGLTATGLAAHDGVDMLDFCCDVYDVPEPEWTIERNHKLGLALADIASLGHELWLFTNAYDGHCVRVLNSLGCLEHFTDATGAIRCVDCFTQWRYSSPQWFNKPHAVAFDCMEACAKVSVPSETVFVEDSIQNLKIPHERGWWTVWIAHGRPVPEGCPHIVIQTIEEIAGVVHRCSNETVQRGGRAHNSHCL